MQNSKIASNINVTANEAASREWRLSVVRLKIVSGEGESF